MTDTLYTAHAGRMYAEAWRRRMPFPVALPSVDLASSYRHTMTMDTISTLPMEAYEGPVHLVRTQEELEQALDVLRQEPIIGFDTETRPVFHKGRTSQVALVQLAGATAVWLVQLQQVPFGQELADLLANPAQIKAGVAIHDDMRGLAQIHPFTAGGVADLGIMAREQGITTVGLRSLTANLLGFRISKSVQCSNWERDVLEPKQVRYAATDAWLGRELYLSLLHLGCKPPVRYPYRRAGVK